MIETVPDVAHSLRIDVGRQTEPWPTLPAACDSCEPSTLRRWHVPFIPPEVDEPAGPPGLRRPYRGPSAALRSLTYHVFRRALLQENSHYVANIVGECLHWSLHCQKILARQLDALLKILARQWSSHSIIPQVLPTITQIDFCFYICGTPQVFSTEY